jgi:hypothetical protein
LRHDASGQRAVQQQLSFPVPYTPEVITMKLANGAAVRDRQYKSITVIFNVSNETQAQTIPSLIGADVRLHPIQENGGDPVVRSAGFATVPARTVAVFVER